MKNHTNAETTYLYATIGSLTARGGRVTLVTGGATFAGLGLARVGDVVTYPEQQPGSAAYYAKRPATSALAGLTTRRPALAISLSTKTVLARRSLPVSVYPIHPRFVRSLWSEAYLQTAM